MGHPQKKKMRKVHHVQGEHHQYYRFTMYQEDLNHALGLTILTPGIIVTVFVFTGYSPHHTTTSRGGAYSPQHSSSTGSSTRVSDSRDPALVTREHVYNVGTLGTRLGNTLLSRAGAQSPARSPATETYKHLESARSVQQFLDLF